MEISLIKTAGGGLRPENQNDADILARLKTGALIHAEIKQPRNPLFHRKFFALLNFAFEYWTPHCEEIRGMMPQKNFERFRKDILITAGFRSLVVNIKGEARWDAESISFSKMDDTRFAEVYRLAFNACWTLVLSSVQGMTEQVVEETINQILAFD